VKKLDFRGSWALVTGASSGLGAEFARQLAHQGTNLILTARSAGKLQRLAEDLARVNGVSTHAIPADLSAQGGVQGLLSAVDALGVSVLHVINNAGFGSTGSFVNADPEQELRMVRLNCESVVAIARHFLPHLVARGTGGLLQVASTSAYQPTPYMATYGASKAFVLSFTLSLAEEARGSGVRILALCPGPVPTGFQEAAGIHGTSAMLKIARLEAPTVVETALAAYRSGRDVAVPGAFNTLQTAAVKLIPRGVVLRAARWAMHGLGRADT
jgi:short-subunit dehydrogenase